LAKIDRVHVVFKTHLDIGFTDLAANVVDKYMYAYIPKAMDLAEQLASEGGPAGFVWTTGSWLIHEYFKRTDTDHARMAEAIRKGYIAWHGLPFTTHTELLDPSLFTYGLSIASGLDRRFGKKTIAAKMTDVPGHTVGMVPLLARQGIRYLHLGVNPASKVPDVPELFVWEGPEGSRIIVNYASDYGGAVSLDHLHDAIVFAHTGDNQGPPSAEQIKEQFARLAVQFPEADIRASTMDAYAERLVAHESQLPVLSEEIGDTWIHGAGTDPRKVAMFRALSRLRVKWLKEGRLDPESGEHTELSDNLLLIAEHTWGMDEKTHLADYRNYSRADFQRAREANQVPGDSAPGKYRHFTGFAMKHEQHAGEFPASSSAGGGSYRLMEKSWAEQRAYIHKAVDALPLALQEEALAAFAQLNAVVEIPEGAHVIHPGKTYPLGPFLVRFASDGAIEQLEDRRGNRWADGNHRIGQFRYEAFGEENYNEWFQQYLENRLHTHGWSDPDFGKPGFEFAEPKPEHRQVVPILDRMALTGEEGEECVYIKLSMPEDTMRLMGAPAAILLTYRFAENSNEVRICVDWTNKSANRQPEAIWFSLNPRVENSNQWKMEKLGQLVSPLAVVKDGNRSLHAVNGGLHYAGADGTARIETADAPLVAPGRPALLQHTNRFASLENGFHFLLYNNIWGTNFPMWYEEDARFRFALVLNSYEKRYSHKKEESEPECG
jgi:hypothetical protein